MAADIKEVLKPDNKVARILTRVCDMAVLNIVWLLTSVFLVTIGPSTVALYIVIEKMRSNTEQGIVRTYFNAFKAEFKNGMFLSLTFWLFFEVLFLDMYLLHKAPGSFNSVMYGGCITLLVFGVAMFVYVFELAAIFENTIKGYFLAAFKLVVCNLPLSVLVICVNVCIPLLFFFLPGVISKFAALILIFGGSSVAYASSYLLGGVMEGLKAKS